jgi:hypothetical protein
LSLGACEKQDLSQINEEPNNIIDEAINVEGFSKLESIQKDDFLNGTTFKK